MIKKKKTLTHTTYSVRINFFEDVFLVSASRFSKRGGFTNLFGCVYPYV